jgi:phosphoribosylanthranilate isomerase
MSAILLQPVRVKICGLTRPRDAALAGQLGADAVGVVLRADSPRRIDEATAMKVLNAAGPFVTRVGLFVDTPPDEIAAVAARLNLHMAQRHGRDVAAVPGVPTIAAATTITPNVTLPLLDGSMGHGTEPDWQRVAEQVAASPTPVMIAGGLTPNNVAAIIAQVRPFAVDVSSGIETAAKGEKDHVKLRAFIAAARRAP